MLYSRLLSSESRKELPFECQHLRVCTTSLLTAFSFFVHHMHNESRVIRLIPPHTQGAAALSLSPIAPIADRAPETDTGATAHPHLAKRAWVGSFRKRRKASGWTLVFTVHRRR